MDNEKTGQENFSSNDNAETNIVIESSDPVVSAFAALHNGDKGEIIQSEASENPCIEPAFLAPLPPALQKKSNQKSAVISTWGWFYTLLLFSIPIIGLLIAALFAGGLTRRQNRVHYARAYLAMIGLFLFLSIIGLLVLWIHLGHDATKALSCLFDGQYKEAVLHLFASH